MNLNRAWNLCRGAMLIASLGFTMSRSSAQVIVEGFDGSAPAEWNVERLSEVGEFDWKPGTPGLWFKTSDQPESPGRAWRTWAIGTKPFEITWDVQMEGGGGQENRIAGIYVAATSAEPGKMGPDDISIVVGVQTEGIAAGVRRGPIYELNQNKEGHPPYRARLLDQWADKLPRPGQRMANARWTDKVLTGKRLSIRMAREAGNVVVFQVFNLGESSSIPWWQARTELDPKLADKPLTHLLIGMPPNPRGNPIHGPQYVLRGWVKDLQARGLGDPKPKIASATPRDSVVEPGSELLISGQGLGNNATVWIGGAAAEVIAAGNGELRVRAPRLEAGARYPLEVRSGDGLFDRLDGGLAYGRILERAEPREALPAGGDEITLIGAGFDPKTEVTVGAKPATIVERIDWTRLKIKVPAGEAGLAEIKVVSAGEPFAGECLFGYAPHPYLMFKQADIPALKEKFNHPQFAAYKTRILKDAAGEVDYDKLEGPDASMHFFAPTLVWALTRDEACREKALKIMQVVGEQRNHDQFQQMKAQAMAFAYDILFPAMSPAQRLHAQAYLERSLDTYLQRTGSGDWWFVNNPSNTIPVGSAGGGMAAMALMNSTPRAKQAIERAPKIVNDHYIAIVGDGGCIEGTLYWDYGLGNQLALGHALKNVTGDDHGLLTAEKLQKNINFVRTQFAGNDQMFSFNDTQPSLTGSAICADFGSRFDQPLMRWFADHQIALSAGTDQAATPRVAINARQQYAVYAFLWRDMTPAPAEFPGVPTLAKLDVMNWGVMRSDGTALKPALALGIKGHGGPLSHHRQADKGNFELHAAGEALIIDPGYYQPKETAHSIPLIDGNGPDPEPQTAAPIVTAWEDGDVRAMNLDVTAPYRKTAQATRVMRHFVMVGDEAVVVLDDLIPAKADATITAQLQAAYATELTGDSTAVVNGALGRLAIQTFGPTLKLEVTSRDFGRSWIFKKWAEAGWVSWHSLQGTYRADPQRPMITVLMPMPLDAKTPTATVNYAPDHIVVALPNGRQVTFNGGPDGWTVAKNTQAK